MNGLDGANGSGIGTLNEKPLHESLKQWYARPGDLTEAPLDGFVIDIVRGDLLVEIQTRNFSAIRRKLEKLLESHPVRLVYPIAGEKWIVRQTGDSRSRRRSPRRGAYEDVFAELVRCPKLLSYPNFSLELLLVREEEVRRYDGVRGWRRHGWVTAERRLLDVLESRVIESPADMAAFLPADLPVPFTTTHLAAALGRTLSYAQKMAYCLDRMGCLTRAGKHGNSILYEVKENDP